MNTPPPPQPLHTGVLILAAGAGRRMGGRAKCLLEVQGHSLLERLVRSVRSLGLQTPVLVLGHHAAEIQAHLAQWPEHLTPRRVVNPAPGDDPASSLHLGLHALGDDVQAVMVLLADQPLINATDIGAVLDAFQRRPAGCQVVVPLVNGVPGHPVMMDAAVRTDLLAAPGGSLRQWRAAHPQATLPWVVDNPHHTRDLDTPDDLIALARDTGWVCRWPEPAPGVNTDPMSS
ncbi:nucleotidyltransferase family protein [Hydrogenophaga sp. PBL-H3]|uniref:nucleotidyltransferase family protein n=1 Tax=Hydrogenophaga sp. PBL-H3 TaxID=434010 RepID=UPI00131FF3C2|nr:nucleotidyltransferase family protein [Hydrogenophaga sp. PBL-H3]QHE77118.1 nucleotidyltransferase family protein [Hydrogenophaga sp. PBL-H3]QHE81542.1 nucleotidyltransferase family protein [Hydrogenophaga sp. PBL-H3]